MQACDDRSELITFPPSASTRETCLGPWPADGGEGCDIAKVRESCMRDDHQGQPDDV